MTRRVDTIAGWVSVRRTRVIYPRVDACHHVSLLRSRCRERPARDGFVDPFRRHAPPPRFRRRRRVDAEPPSRLRLAPRLFLQRRQAPRALRVPQPRSARVQRAGSRTVGNAVQATRAAHRHVAEPGVRGAAARGGAARATHVAAASRAAKVSSRHPSAAVGRHSDTPTRNAARPSPSSAARRVSARARSRALATCRTRSSAAFASSSAEDVARTRSVTSRRAAASSAPR